MIKARNANQALKLFGVSLLGFTLLASTVLSMAQPAAAGVSHLVIWSIPRVSYIGDGTNQIVAFKAFVDPGEFVEGVRISIDEGTAEERNYSGEVDGNEDHATKVEPGFVDFFCIATFFNHPYTTGDSKIECWLTLDKEAFDVGTHPTKVYLTLGSGTFTDEGSFTLLASPDSLADLVNRRFRAPNNVDEGDIKKTRTAVKNEGERNARGFWIKIYLSHNDELDSHDTVVGKRWVPILKENHWKLFRIGVTIPNHEYLGSEFFISMVDAGSHFGQSQVGEQDETNNDRSRAVTIHSG